MTQLPREFLFRSFSLSDRPPVLVSPHPCFEKSLADFRVLVRPAADRESEWASIPVERVRFTDLPTESNDDENTTTVKVLDPIGDQIRRSERATDRTGCLTCAFRRRRLRPGCLCNLPREWILVRGPGKLKVKVRSDFTSVEGCSNDRADDISDRRRPKIASSSPGRNMAAASKLIIVWRGIHPGVGKEWSIKYECEVT